MTLPIITLQGRNVATDAGRIIFTDTLEGRAGTLDIVLPGYPETVPARGAAITASMDGVPWGDFEVDEVEVSGPPDVLEVRATAARVTVALRTKRSATYESRTLRSIMETVAARSGFGISGNVPDIRISRETQMRETDLAFISRMAKKYGASFTARGRDLVFFLYADEASAPVRVIHREDVSQYSFGRLTVGGFSSAEVASVDIEAGLVGDLATGGVNVNDVLALRERIENATQGRLVASAALRRKNADTAGAVFDMPGNAYILAGTIVQASGWPGFDTRYMVEKVTHTVDAVAGWNCVVECRAVR